MAVQTHWDADGVGREMRHGVVSLAVVDGQSMTVGVTRLEPGHEEKPHAHPNEQIACILQGEVEFHVGEEVLHMGPGDILVIPPNVVHYGKAVGSIPAINLDAWYPRRVPGT